MKTFILVIFLVLLMMSSQVYAEGKIYGYGGETCGRFVKVLEGERRGDNNDSVVYFGFMSWFSGLATGASFQSEEDVLHGRDTASVELWLENYCREHPSDNFFRASVNLMGALKK
jgi:accessory colonization factor AcfC